MGESMRLKLDFNRVRLLRRIICRSTRNTHEQGHLRSNHLRIKTSLMTLSMIHIHKISSKSSTYVLSPHLNSKSGEVTATNTSATSSSVSNAVPQTQTRKHHLVSAMPKSSLSHLAPKLCVSTCLKAALTTTNMRLTRH